MDKLPDMPSCVAAIALVFLPAACAPREAQPLSSARADGVMADSTPLSVERKGTEGMTIPPPSPPAWHCFENDMAPGLDNACGLSAAECRKLLRIHGQNAAHRGVQFQSDRGCTPGVDMPFCFWVELDAERIGYVCRETMASCERAADATSYPLRSICAQAPRVGLAYAGSH